MLGSELSGGSVHSHHHDQTTHHDHPVGDHDGHADNSNHHHCVCLVNHSDHEPSQDAYHHCQHDPHPYEAMIQLDKYYAIPLEDK